jgi:hypothetical protein
LEGAPTADADPVELTGCLVFVVRVASGLEVPLTLESDGASVLARPVPRPAETEARLTVGRDVA